MGDDLKNTVVLFSGVHGVGKGYFIENKLKGIDGITIVSASSIISGSKPAEDAGYKKVDNINTNQDVLLTAFARLHFNTDIVVLDGHLVLLNGLNKIERIPIGFIQGIHLAGIILLQDESNVIAERLYNRDGISLPAETIELIQEDEYMYCQQLCCDYGIPFIRISHEESTDIIERFLQMCEESNE